MEEQCHNYTKDPDTGEFVDDRCKNVSCQSNSDCQSVYCDPRYLLCAPHKHHELYIMIYVGIAIAAICVLTITIVVCARKRKLRKSIKKSYLMRSSLQPIVELPEEESEFTPRFEVHVKQPGSPANKMKPLRPQVPRKVNEAVPAPRPVNDSLQKNSDLDVVSSSSPHYTFHF